MKSLDRSDFVNENGKASWWSKDGAWHVARPRDKEDGLFWTYESYATREDAVKALQVPVVTSV